MLGRYISRGAREEKRALLLLRSAGWMGGLIHTITCFGYGPGSVHVHVSTHAQEIMRTRP